MTFGSDQQHKVFLGDIQTSARHLRRLFNDVHDRSKVEAGKLEYRHEREQLAPLVAELLAILRATAAEKHLCLEPELDSTLTDFLFLDPARLEAERPL